MSEPAQDVTQENRKPAVMFVCVHNAGRSQMAAGWLRSLSHGAVEVRSGGTAPAERVNPVAVQAMREVGIDITHAAPRALSTEDVEVSDVVVTMGCGDSCPYVPGRRYEDWQLDDPAGRDLDTVRRIRDQIRKKVETLISELLPVEAPS